MSSTEDPEYASSGRIKSTSIGNKQTMYLKISHKNNKLLLYNRVTNRQNVNKCKSKNSHKILVNSKTILTTATATIIIFLNLALTTITINAYQEFEGATTTTRFSNNNNNNNNFTSTFNNNNGDTDLDVAPVEVPKSQGNGDSTIGMGSVGEGGLVFGIPSIIKPNEDPETLADIVHKARNNELKADLETNRTKAMVSCDNGEMLVKLNFTEPFRGFAYADFDTSSPCKFNGEGGKYYEMRLPLKGCGTKQQAPRLFINNIVLRFHKSLALVEDEVKTIVCRYPPPEVPAPPPPPGIPARIIDSPPETAKLTQYEPMVIIAGLLFFALALAALGTTTYVTRKQVLKPINEPLPIVAHTDEQFYIDNQSIVTIEELTTSQKIIPFPKISAHIVEDVFLTNLHQTEIVENLTHHKQPMALPMAQYERQEFEDVYITQQDEIEEEQTISQQQLARLQRFDQLACDDTYVTNQDEILEEETLVSNKLRSAPSKLEIRTIEDTFITKVDEVIKDVNTTYRQRDQNLEKSQSCLNGNVLSGSGSGSNRQHSSSVLLDESMTYVDLLNDDDEATTKRNYGRYL